MTYSNLHNVVKTNPQSAALLDLGQNLKIARIGLVVAGAGMVLAGFFNSGCRTEIPGDCAKAAQKDGLNVALIAAGTLTCLVPLVMKKPSEKFREAVYIFNK